MCWGGRFRDAVVKCRRARPHPACGRGVARPADASSIRGRAQDRTAQRRRGPGCGVHRGTAYRAELSVRVDQPVLSDDPVLQRDLQLPDSWWQDLAVTLEKVAAVDTDRVAVRQQFMDRAIPEFVGIPAPAVTRWTAAHSDLHWANVTAPLRILDWEGWGRAPRRDSTPPRSTPTHCSRRTSPPASETSSLSWAARPASQPTAASPHAACGPSSTAGASRWAFAGAASSPAIPGRCCWRRSSAWACWPSRHCHCG